MRGNWPGFILIAYILVAASVARAAAPNILVIVADDLGYTDIGAFGSEISTPTLDRLAREGIRLTNFHALPTCAPTRAVLLTGNDNHVVGLGAQVPSGKQRGMPGYEGYIAREVPTLAEVLLGAGYRTYMSGKWHLGTKPGQRPHDRGFEETFSLLSGAASHFADARPVTPEEPVYYSRNGVLIDKLPADFYSTRVYTDYLLAWLERDKDSDSPFFAYLAFTAPHDPLQAPEKYIEKYRGQYSQGFEFLRERRHRAAVSMGVLPGSMQLPAWPTIVRRWASLSAEEQANKTRDMETYAGMIDYMDVQIGRVIDWLDKEDQLDNTFILFMSDNGANAFAANIYPGHSEEFHSSFDNSILNRGKIGSYTELGGGWATASSGGLRLFKGFPTEGGIRVPAIIKPAGSNPGAINNGFLHVRDIMPTLLEVAGIHHPSEGGPTVHPILGQNLHPLFVGNASYVVPAKGAGYELHGTRAYIDWPWKVLRLPIPLGNDTWQLFDLESDPGELHNLASNEPEVLSRLVKSYRDYEKQVGVVYDLTGLLKISTLLDKVLLPTVALIGLFALWAWWKRRWALFTCNAIGMALLLTCRYYLHSGNAISLMLG